MKKDFYTKHRETNNGFVCESVPIQRLSSMDTPNTFMPYNSFKEECLASIFEAEEEYQRTGEAVDFEVMMADFKQKFKW